MKDGKLTQACKTSWRWFSGDNVTTNIKTIKFNSLTIKGDYPQKFETFEVRFVFSHLRGFAKMNAERIENGEEPYMNSLEIFTAFLEA